MTISNKSSITGPIPGWAVGGVGLTITNYRTCITLIYTNYTSSGVVFKLQKITVYRKLLVCIK